MEIWFPNCQFRDTIAALTPLGKKEASLRPVSQSVVGFLLARTPTFLLLLEKQDWGRGIWFPCPGGRGTVSATQQQ